MIKQTDPQTGPVIYHFGCYLFDILSIAEEATGLVFDWDRVSAIYQAGIKAEIIGYLDDAGNFQPGESTKPLDGCYVQDALKLLNLAGVSKAEIIMNPSDPAGMWPVGSNIPDGAYIIQQWHNDASGFTHYVRGNPDGSVKWDPIQYDNGAGSNTVAHGRLVSLRLVSVL